MAGAGKAPLVTWDEFVLLDEDDPRELIDGVLVDIDGLPEPKRAGALHHAHTVAALAGQIWAWATAGDRGVVLASGYEVRLPDGQGVVPDLQFVSKEKLGLLDEDGMTRAVPDLVVEVSLRSSRARNRAKVVSYAAAGVGEYWIVDPEYRMLEQFVLGPDGRYVIAVGGLEDEVFEPESFPGLSITLSRLWID